MPRFVLLHHDHPTPHHDLMLEGAGSLHTWRLPVDLTDDMRAIAIADHRLAYLDAEGPVSGGRGQVVRVDMGTFERIDAETVQFVGKRLLGTYTLTASRLAKQPSA